MNMLKHLIHLYGVWYLNWGYIVFTFIAPFVGWHLCDFVKKHNKNEGLWFAYYMIFLLFMGCLAIYGKLN